MIYLVINQIDLSIWAGRIGKAQRLYYENRRAKVVLSGPVCADKEGLIELLT